jgi:hypothetical protein
MRSYVACDYDSGDNTEIIVIPQLNIKSEGFSIELIPIDARCL